MLHWLFWELEMKTGIVSAKNNERLYNVFQNNDSSQEPLSPLAVCCSQLFATNCPSRAIGGAGPYRWLFGSAQTCTCTTLFFAESFQIGLVQFCFQILQLTFFPHQFTYFSWLWTTWWSRIIVVTFFRWHEVDGIWRTENFSCLFFVVVRQDGLL